MADVLIYRNGQARLVRSRHTPEYEADPTAAVSPVLPAGVPLRRLKVVAGKVALKTAAEIVADDKADVQVALKADRERLIEQEMRRLAVASLKRRGAWV